MRKLDLAKKKREEESKHKLVTEFVLDQSDQIHAIEKTAEAIDRLYELINEQEPVDLTKLAEQLETLNDKLDLSDALTSLQKAVEGTKVEKVSINEFSALLAAVKANKPLPNPKIDLTSLEKAIIQVQQRIQEASAPNQAPEDYTAMRRVIKVGNRLVFDDTPTGGGRGGGGGVSDLRNNHAILHQPVDISSSGSNTIIGGQQGMKIKLLSAVLVAGGTVSVTWQSDSDDLSGEIPLVVNSGLVLPASSPAQGEYLATDTGSALNINLSDGVQVSGHVSYYLDT